MTTTRFRRGVELSLTALIVIVLLLIFLIVIGFPWIKKTAQALTSAYACDGECMQSCGDGYEHEWKGDTYCKEYFGKGEAGGGTCCLPLGLGNNVVRGGDIRIYDQSKKLLGNGATLTLKIESPGKIATGKLPLLIANSAKGKQCYWQIEKTGEAGVWYATSDSKTIDFDAVTSSTTGPPSPQIPKECKSQTYDLLASIPKNLGASYKLSLVVLDYNKCEYKNNPDLCDSYVHTINVKVPDRTPRITVALDGKSVAQNAFTPITQGTHNLVITINEPLVNCEIKGDGPPGTTPAPADKNIFKNVKFPVTGESNNCFASNPLKKTFTITVPADVPPGIPYTLNVSTSLGTKGAQGYRATVASYTFYVAPDPRFLVRGPSSGLSKEKMVEIACKDITCQPEKFSVAYVGNAFGCNKDAIGFNPIANLTKYGTTEQRWRFIVKDEQESGNYVCVKAETPNGVFVSLGLSDNVALPLAIDRTPPVIDLSWNSFEGVLDMKCADAGSNEKYVSGCKDRPFSIAFITDPLLFLADVATGGMLAPTFGGCPNPDTGLWIAHNSDNNKYNYLSRDIRVICVRATDNAGNSAVTSKLLFSSQEVLALLLAEYGQHQNK